MHLTEAAHLRPEVQQEPAIKGSPRLGLLIIVAVCVPFWAAVWWALT